MVESTSQQCQELNVERDNSRIQIKVSLTGNILNYKNIEIICVKTSETTRHEHEMRVEEHETIDHRGMMMKAEVRTGYFWFDKTYLDSIKEYAGR